MKNVASKLWVLCKQFRNHFELPVRPSVCTTERIFIKFDAGEICDNLSSCLALQSDRTVLWVQEEVLWVQEDVLWIQEEVLWVQEEVFLKFDSGVFHWNLYT